MTEPVPYRCLIPDEWRLVHGINISATTRLRQINAGTVAETTTS